MRFILAFVCAWSFQLLHAQQNTEVFSIIYKDKPIGTLVASKTHEGERVTYRNQTHIATRILLANVKVDYQYEVHYDGQQLKKAKAQVFLNDKLRTDALTTYAKPKYTFWQDGEIHREIESPILYSTVRLLFEEPIDITQVYAEEHGDFHELEKIDAHEYLKTNAKGRCNTYRYENGKLEKAVIDIGLISFEIRRKKT